MDRWRLSLLIFSSVAALSFGGEQAPSKQPVATPRVADKSTEALRLLARTQFEVAVSARDAEHDPIKAAHYFLHAGLNAHAAGDEQLVIDAGHAAQEVAGAVEFTFSHGANVTGAVLSPDQELLCSWSYEERSVRLWSLKTGQLVKSLTLPAGVGRVQFHPTERTLLIDAEDLVAIWPFDQDEISHSFNPNAGKSSHGVTRSQFHGRDIWVGGSPQGWQWHPGDEPQPLDGTFARVIVGNHSEFHAEIVNVGDRTLMAKADRSGGQVRDWQTGEHLRSCSRGQVLRIKLNPHNRQVLTWSRPGPKEHTVATLWSLDQAEPLQELGNMPAPVDPVLSPDGKHLVIWGDHHTSEWDKGAPASATALSLWSWADRKIVQTIPLDGTVAGAQFDSSGRHLVTWSQRGTVNLWRIVDEVSPVTGEKRTQVAELLWQCQANGGVVAIKFHPTQPQVLIINRQKQAQLIAIPQYRAFGDAALAAKVIRRFVNSVVGAEFSRDGKRLVTWGDERLARVWNLEHGIPTKLFRTTNSVGNPPRPLWLSGDRLLTGYSSKPLQMWSLRTREALWTAPEDAKFLFVDGSPSGDHLFLRRTAQPPNKSAEQLELWSIHEPAPLKVWPFEFNGRGDRGFRFISERRYMMWHKHDLWLHEIGRDEPLRQWKAKLWYYNVMPLSDGQRLIATTNTNKYGEGELLVLLLDSDEPLSQVDVKCDFAFSKLLAGEQGLLMWQQADRGDQVLAQVLFFDPKRSAVTLENFLTRDASGDGLDTTDFDAKSRFVVHPNSRRLWSTETGKILYEFRRRTPAQGGGYDETNHMQLKLDPLGRFLVSWGPSANRRDYRLKIWSLADLQPDAEWQPVAQHELRDADVMSVRSDGTFIVDLRGELWLMSSSGQSQPLRQITGPGPYNLGQSRVHPETGHVYGTNNSGEIFEWRLTTWNADDLHRELSELERRSGQHLDPALGRLR